MMAAVQPFLSGAISKTVNMPEAATVEEVEKIYLEGWKLGLKALAIYRDNCKVGPAAVGGQEGQAGRGRGQPAQTVVEYRPVRKRLPKKRPSQTVSFTVGGAEGYLTASSYPDDGLGEVFVKSRQAGLDAGRRDGRLLDGDLDRPAVRHAAGDVRLEVLEHAVRAGGHDRRPGHADRRQRDGLHVPPAGAGLPAVREARAELGIFTAEERAAQVGREPTGRPRSTWTALALGRRARPAPVKPAGGRAARRRPDGRAAPRPSCWSCTWARPRTRRCASPAARRCARPGRCYVCEGCGSTSGCS